MPTHPAATTSLGEALGRARSLSDDLFGMVAPDALYHRPIAERHRMIFYLGHLEAFDWNQARRALGLGPLEAAFDQLFAFGIDPPAGSLPADTPADWPSADEVHDYNRRVRQAIDRLLPDLPEQIQHVNLEHRLMHIETFAYILHNEERPRPILPPESDGAPPPRRMIAIPARTATLGQPRGGAFGWDNEFGEHRAEVPAFSISRHKVTNGEYLAFVERGADPPHYWRLRDGKWFWRGMLADYPLPPDWPVYCTHRQAASYAAWKGCALPSEQQFQVAAYGTPGGSERAYPWGSAAPVPAHGNFDCQRWDPAPVTRYPAGDSAFGVSQLAGNGWEWTSTVFGPLPGFEPFPFYPGYSADFFDGDHYVMKGAGPRTGAVFLRRSFRNWFRQDYPYVHAAFRLAGER